MPITRSLQWSGSPYMKLSDLLEFTDMIRNSCNPSDDYSKMIVHFRIDPGSNYPGDVSQLHMDVDLP